MRKVLSVHPRYRSAHRNSVAMGADVAKIQMEPLTVNGEWEHHGHQSKPCGESNPCQPRRQQYLLLRAAARLRHHQLVPGSARSVRVSSRSVEGVFGILAKHSLSRTDFPSRKAIRAHIEFYTDHWNDHPTPFIWTKPTAVIIRSHRRMLARISNAVH